MLLLITWLRNCLASFSPVKFLSTFILKSLEETHYVQPMLQEYGDMLYKLLRSSALDICLFSPIHLLIQSRICIYVCYLLYTLSYKPVLLCFVVQIVPDLASGSSFNWILCPFNTCSHYIVFLFDYVLTFCLYKML